jgi:hypothetical protein
MEAGHRNVHPLRARYQFGVHRLPLGEIQVVPCKLALKLVAPPGVRPLDPPGEDWSQQRAEYASEGDI